MVEIDTLWNVKTDNPKKHETRIRRNRYIVECKGKSWECSLIFRMVEIDTLWNVK